MEWTLDSLSSRQLAEAYSMVAAQLHCSTNDRYGCRMGRTLRLKSTLVRARLRSGMPHGRFTRLTGGRRRPQMGGRYSCRGILAKSNPDWPICETDHETQGAMEDAGDRSNGRAGKLPEKEERQRRRMMRRAERRPTSQRAKAWRAPIVTAA